MTVPGGIGLEDAMKQAYETVPDDVIFYDTLEINHTTFDDPILVVRSYESLVTSQGTFLPVHFDFTLPETEGSVRGEMTIRLQFITGEARRAIREAAQDPNVITVKYRGYLEGSLTAPDAELPALLQVSSVTETPGGIEARALLPDLFGQYFPRRLMTVDSLPGCRT
jgi:hypothetical protein